MNNSSKMSLKTIKQTVLTVILLAIAVPVFAVTHGFWQGVVVAVIVAYCIGMIVMIARFGRNGGSKS